MLVSIFVELADDYNPQRDYNSLKDRVKSIVDEYSFADGVVCIYPVECSRCVEFKEEMKK